MIRESAKDRKVYLYYAPEDDVHLCVVATPADESERFVATAYCTKNIEKGTELWTS